MARPKALDNTQVKWAFSQRCRGCKMDDIAAELSVNRRTLQREFRSRNLRVPKPLPDEEWIKPHFATK